VGESPVRRTANRERGAGAAVRTRDEFRQWYRTLRTPLPGVSGATAVAVAQSRTLNAENLKQSLWT
jgi:hypothetical protein